MTAFSDRAYDYFLGNGLSPYAAAALAGNAQHESGGNPTIIGDKGTSFGLFQWHDPQQGSGRWTDLQNWAKARNLDPTSETTQLQFAKQELDKQGLTEKLNAAPDLKGAHDIVMGYLKPQGYTDSNPAGGLGYAQRYNIAAPYVGAQTMSVPIGAAPGDNTPSVAMADPRTAGDADLGGYGAGASIPTAAPAASSAVLALLAQNRLNAISTASQGLLAQGAPQQSQMQMPSIPLIQAGRPLRPVSLSDFTTRRGLLG